MSFQKINNQIRAYYHLYLRGWSTNDKIVVIESDDWGSIRVNPNSFIGNKNSIDAFSRVDTLETETDFELLLDMLKSITKTVGIKPVITTNTIVTNPDFEEIERDNYFSYHYEPFIQTYEKYPKCGDAFASYQKGIKDGFLFPQFHGREHVNVIFWLSALRSQHKEVLSDFKEKSFRRYLIPPIADKNNLMSAWNFQNATELNFINESIKSGLNLFESIFKYRSASSIAPTALWCKQNEDALNQEGVKYIQSFVTQELPYSQKYKKVLHYTGEKNSIGQTYLVRNCYFEPSTKDNFNWIAHCINQMKTAFFFGKPAIISTHRINFVGGVSESNRKQGIEKLRLLLMRISKEWPEAVFMSSSELGELINRK